jgi:hypothetical protein
MPWRHHQILKLRPAASRGEAACLAQVWIDRGFGSGPTTRVSWEAWPDAGFFVVTSSTLHPDEGEARLAPTTRPVATVTRVCRGV